ncbi:hypothetical protein [Terrimonas sp.]|uniref:hypothetical protein n=1 Tax=Terrimonas sp. TaxID=1914338 RepID=UPI000E32C4E4|nr:hypothetical protein [Terrimonas sp.]
MSRSDRIAVVVVHGMGNQFPMDTLRGFVEALQKPNATLYSSPNRITDDLELRRLSFREEKMDYFEYYWAHEMEEPKLGETLLWSLKLLFVKKRSASFKKHIYKVYLLLLSIILLVAAIAGGVFWLFKDEIQGLLAVSVYGFSVAVLIRFVWSLLSGSIIGSVQSSIGDVVKYTIPSPGNIAVRDKIRKKGIELLKKLHEAKKEDGKTKSYHKIIVVGHSLGSIVAYDILNSLFAEYHTAFENIPGYFKQEELDKLLLASSNPDHTSYNYQNIQNAVFNEYQSLGCKWRIHQFITLGSPLTHAPMLLNKKLDDFARKKQQREFPSSPPQPDDKDKHFVFKKNYKSSKGKPRTVKILHHAALFGITQWTNIYYKNDWIGGALSPEFGKGIKDVELMANNRWTRLIPMATHTKYWDKKDNGGLTEIEKLLERSGRYWKE